MPNSVPDFPIFPNSSRIRTNRSVQDRTIELPQVLVNSSLRAAPWRASVWTGRRPSADGPHYQSDAANRAGSEKPAHRCQISRKSVLVEFAFRSVQIVVACPHWRSAGKAGRDVHAAQQKDRLRPADPLAPERRPAGGSAREIADRFGLSKGFLANILKELCQKGFLDQPPRREGRLLPGPPRRPDQPGRVAGALEDGWKLTTCTGQEDHGRARLHRPQPLPDPRPAERDPPAIVGVLRNVTLADVMRQPGPNRRRSSRSCRILGHRTAAGRRVLHEITA